MADGSCHEAFGCPVPIAGARKCMLCGKVYGFCKAHKPWALSCMSGHVLRVHPEVVSDTHIDKILDDEKKLQGFREQHRLHPDLWEKLIARFDARIEARRAEAS